MKEHQTLRFRYGADLPVWRHARVSYTGTAMPTAAVKLPAALEKFVASQVSEGTYRSREAAIVAAVQHQKRRSDQLAWLRSEIQKGLDSGPAGELDIENVIRRGRRRVAARARRARS
jgi:antitoxin ParD1/3/4